MTSEAAKKPIQDWNGIAAQQLTVALLQFLSIEFAGALWLALNE